jgi:hypothetical protein
VIKGKGSVGRIALLGAALMTVSAVSPAAGVPQVAAGPTAYPPTIHLRQPGALTAVAVPIVVSWPAASTAGSAIHRYELQRSVDGGPWLNVSLPSRLARAKTVKQRPWQVVAFRVRATDTAAQASGWATSAPVWMSTAQESDESVDLSPGWQSVADAKSYGGARQTAATQGEWAAFTFTGREVAWVAQRGPAKGLADVYLDGTLAATVDLYKSTNAKKRIVFRAQWPSVSEHRLDVVVAGTPVRPNVDIDAFVVLTAPVAETLVGAGDIASCDDSDDEATAAIVAEVAGIVYTTGDNVYPDGTAENFANCYDPSWGTFKNRTRPTPGNHDYYNNPGAGPYFDYFGDNAGPAGRGWYRYEAGTWRVYALNSECGPSSACGIAQREWLEADLAAEPHRCVLAMWHRPRFSSGLGHGSSTRMAAIFELLYDHGAELVLAGHEHNYERFAPADPTGAVDPLGVRQFVVGTGGASRYGFGAPLPATEVRDASTYGVLRLDLAPGSYSWEFLPEAGKTFTDSGAGTCH